MKDNIPLVYWTFRTAWTAVHFLAVLTAMFLVIWWAFVDGNGGRLLGGGMHDLLDVQRAVARVIPWPWNV
jgi:hypothetical protein